jgi:hypothetical protein
MSKPFLSFIRGSILPADHIPDIVSLQRFSGRGGFNSVGELN